MTKSNGILLTEPDAARLERSIIEQLLVLAERRVRRN